MTVVDSHPQKQLIIEQLLAGESMRKIARSVVPPVHHTSLARFRLKVVGSVAATIRGRNPTALAIKDVAQASDTTRPAAVVNEEAANSLRLRVHGAIDKRLERRSTEWFPDAQRVPIHNEEGEIVGYRMDHRALAAHDANELKDLRTIAELGGLLNQPAQSVTVNAVVQLPGPQEQFRQLEQREAIDIAVVEVSEAK